MEKDEVMKIGDNYLVMPDGRQVRIEPIVSKETGEVIGQKEIEFANHAVIVQEQRVVDNGIEPIEQIVVQTKRAGRLWGKVPITLKDILGSTPNCKFGAACRIYPNVRGAKGYYTEAIQIQCENIPQSVIYQHTGYIIDNGKRVFLNGANSVTAEGLTDEYTVELDGKLSRYRFTNEKHDSRYNTLLRDLPKVAPKPLIYAGLAYTFLTPLNAMLQDLGCEPRFILYFTGKTGSRKSTMANLFLSFFGEFRETESAPISFKDTPNAAEMAMALLNSTMTLLDDRIPSTTKGVKDQMERMEQSVARAIGDRAGRARLNADSTLKAVYRPVCNLIITAEEAYSNTGESAIARSISCDIKPGDIDLDALTAVQLKAGELNECMSEYIQYVIVHWDELSEEIKTLFFDLRSKAQNGGHGRLAVAVAHLYIGFYVMCKWIVAVEVLTAEQGEALKAQAWDVFMELSEEQNRRIHDETPVELFLTAVKAMIEHGSITVHDVNEEISLGNSMAFKDSNYYYFSPEQIYAKVKEFYAMQGLNYPVSLKTLDSHLINDKLEEPEISKSTGRVNPHKSKRINGKQARFMWIYTKAFENREEEEA